MFLVMLSRSGPMWDSSRPMEEQADWAAHAAFMDGLVDSGFVVLGGPLADEHRVAHVVEAESEAAVRATPEPGSVERDPSSGRGRRAVDDPTRRAAYLSRAGPPRVLAQKLPVCAALVRDCVNSSA